MNLSDLRVFVSAARAPSLGATALALHLTPSAVSKALKRLEDGLGTPLFDRSARQLVLNVAGERLLARAQHLLALAEQTRADVMGERADIDIQLGGPAVLLWRQAEGMARAMQAMPQASLRLQAMFEDEALAALGRGDIHAAIVTGAAIEGRGAHWSGHWQATDLGSLTLHLVAGQRHPFLAGLKKRGRDYRASTAQVLEQDFACPSRSLFCGVQRGTRSDGWRDDQLPRRIRYWTDDLQLLLGFVHSGQALAYLPDFALQDPHLARIQVSDCAYTCSEQAWLVWDRSTGGAWQQELSATLGDFSPHGANQ